MAAPLKKFASQMQPELLAELQKIADAEGRQLQSVLGEAAQEYVNRKKGMRVRPEIAESFRRSLERHDELYRLLAR